MKSSLFLWTLFLSIIAYASSITPKWETLKELKTDNAIYLLQNQRQLFSATVEPDRSKVSSLVLQPESRKLVIQTTKAFADGVKKVNLNVWTIGQKEFTAPFYQMSITLQGPKNAGIILFFEGRTPAGKHFYLARKMILSGERETLDFTAKLPQKMRDLHLRFDLLSPGEYQLLDCTFTPVEHPQVQKVPSVTPVWSDLKRLSSGNTVFYQSGDRRVLRLTNEPYAILESTIHTSLLPDGLLVDTGTAFAAGARKVNLVFLTIPQTEFPDPLYRLTLVLQGPKDAKVALYFEGTTPEGKHFYQSRIATLSGTRETVDFTSEIPWKMRELHLRFDFLSPGIFRIYQADFTPSEPEKPPVPPSTAHPVKLIFYAPFDGSPEAAVADGEKKPLEIKALSYAQGIRGRALRVGKESRLSYSRIKNFLPERGTVLLWFKPEWKFFGDTTGNSAFWRGLVSMVPQRKRGNSGTVQLWCWGNFPRCDTSDPQDRYLTSSLALEPGNWYHIAFAWDEKTGKKSLYLDGKRVDSPADDASPLRTALPPFADPKQVMDHFFVGSLNGIHPALGLIDELKIYSGVLTAEEIVQEATADSPLSVRLLQPFLMESTPGKLEFLLANKQNQAVSGKWVLRAGTLPQSVLKSGDFTVGAHTELHISEALTNPAPGRYILTVESGQQIRKHVLRILAKSSKWNAPPGELKLQHIETVRPETILDTGRLLAIGEVKNKTLEGKNYIEAGTRRGDRFAVRFRLPDADGAYLIEYDYPDDAMRTADVIAQSSRLNTVEYELQLGYYTGGTYRNSGKTLTSRNLYFPNSDDIALIFMTARENEPAAVGEIRISKVIGGLPDAGISTAPEVNRRNRSIGIYYEDPSVNYGFGVQGSSPDCLEEMLDRMVSYMKYSGQNALVYPMVWYQGMIADSSYNPRTHVPGFLSALLHKFDANGLDFFAAFNWHNLPEYRDRVSERDTKSGALHRTPFALYASGRPNPGSWHGSPPNFNIFHVETQKAILENVDRILETGAAHPSFKGIVFHLTRHSLLWPGSLESGYNDYVIEAFEKETKIRIPVDRKHPLRAREYARWLRENAKKEWVDFRCAKLAEFYGKVAKRLADRRPDLRLIVNSFNVVGEVRSPGYTQESFIPEQLREAGLAPEYYRDIPNIEWQQTIVPADPRWFRGRNVEPKAFAKMATIEENPQCYTLLYGTEKPWLHMHDRYWESAIGAHLKEHWSDKPNPLTSNWLKEQFWRASTLNPAGVHAMRHYVLPLRYLDLLGITKGGILVGTYGMEAYLTAFAKAFRALPAKIFQDLPVNSETVRVRRLEHAGRTWFYLVNTSEVPTEVIVKIEGGKVFDLVREAPAELKGDQLALRLEAYELRSFRTDGNKTVRVVVK